MGKVVIDHGTRNPDSSILRPVKRIFSFYLSLHYQNNCLKNFCFLYLAFFNSLAKKKNLGRKTGGGGRGHLSPPKRQVTPVVGNADRYHVKTHQLETMRHNIPHLII
jgi:hypothetical protein